MRRDVLIVLLLVAVLGAGTLAADQTPIVGEFCADTVCPIYIPRGSCDFCQYWFCAGCWRRGTGFEAAVAVTLLRSPACFASVAVGWWGWVTT